MSKVYRVFKGDIETLDYLSEAEQTYLCKSANGVIHRVWKLRAKSTYSGDPCIYHTEKSFTNLFEAKDYAKEQLHGMQEYHSVKMNGFQKRLLKL